MKISNTHRLYILLRLFVAVSVGFLPIRGAFAASFMPVVTNYQAGDYHAQLQNWDASQLPSGKMCFANNDGVLTFDGFTWQLLPIPGNFIVRSVYAKGNRIYAGSFEDFGFYQPDSQGAMRYHSLSEGIGHDKLRDDEFWNIVNIGTDFYFQSFQAVYRYSSVDGKVYRLPTHDISPEHKRMLPLSIFQYRGQLLMQNINGGVYRFSGGSWHKAFDTDAKGGRVIGIAGDVIATENNGLMRMRPDFTALPYPTGIDTRIRNFHLNSIAAMPDGSIAVGTIGDGVYLLSPQGKMLWHISRQEGGLCNNAVLGLDADGFGNLWVMLDDGIALIHTAAPYSMLRPDNDAVDIGMVYDIGASPDGSLLVAANQGAYRVDEGSLTPFSLINGTKGQNWCVRRFDGQSFIGGNEQIFEFESSDLSGRMPGSCTDMKRGEINGQQVLVQTSYYDINIFTNENGRWRRSHTVKGLGAPLFQVEIDQNGDIWASHLTRGIMRIRLTHDLDSVSDHRLYRRIAPGKGAQKCYVMKIRGRMVFSDDTHLYIYNENTDSFEPFEAFSSQLPWIIGAHSATAVDDSDFWLSTASAYHLIRFDGSKYSERLTIPHDNFIRKVNGVNSRVYFDGDHSSYFNLNGAIGRIDMDDIDRPARFKPTLGIASVGYRNSLNIYMPLPDAVGEGQASAEASDGNLRLVLSYPDFDHRLLRYRFTLQGGGDDMVSVLNVPEISYPSLDPGNYSILCEVLDHNGHVLGDLKYRVSVPRPWPLRWWAICLYIIIIVVGGVAISRFFMKKRLTLERQRLAQERADHDREIHRQQLVIAEQQKKLLEQQLTEKGKELASMALGAYSRQQVISQLKESISDARSKGSASTFKMLTTHLKDLSEAEGDSREFWSIFEKNFDLIHEHFFRNLRMKYPQLTPSDLRVCALMRLNLTTKDIARLQGMTVRGVETARYRIRKKLSLGSDVNLNEFMIDFHPDADSPE